MSKQKKILVFFIAILFLVFLEVLRLHYTIEAVRVNKEINIKRKEVRNLEKGITKEKIKLIHKVDLDEMKKKAETELDMEVSKQIKYVKIKKSVSKQNN